MYFTLSAIDMKEVKIQAGILNVLAYYSGIMYGAAQYYVFLRSTNQQIYGKIR